jgi:ABC-type Mn2+/Zn2+ transport system ATPase subunit
MNMLVVKNLVVRIESKALIENINFELRPNEWLVIIGPNGAGKTVLLKALLRLLPYPVEITWAPDVKIGYVPQKINAESLHQIPPMEPLLNLSSRYTEIRKRPTIQQQVEGQELSVSHLLRRKECCHVSEAH